MRYTLALAVVVALTVGSAITFRYQAAKAAHEQVLLAQADAAGERPAETARPSDAAGAVRPATPAPPGVANDPFSNGPQRIISIDRAEGPVGTANYFTVQQGWPAGGVAAAASPDNELANQDRQLEQEVGALVRQLADAPDETQRDELKKKLIDSLEKQFDAQQNLRELEVTQIEARVQKLRELIRKRTDSRRRIIDNRYEQLLNDAEGLGWSSTGSGGAGIAPVGLPNKPLLGYPPASGLPPAAPTPR